MRNRTVINRVAITVILIFTIFSANAYAFNTYYKKEFKEKIINGVDYQRDICLTDQGWLNTHVLKIDYTKSYIDVVPVYTKEVYGKRDTVTNFLKGENFIAGINGDYFDMRNSISYPIGTLVEHGKLLATSNINELCDNYATVFLSRTNPFIDFFDVNMKLSTNGQVLYNIKHLNKITNFDVPVVIDNSDLIPDTSVADSTYKKTLYKVVMVNNAIVYVSTKGETVKVPKGGHVLVLKEKDFLPYKDILTVGQTVQLDMSTSINIEKVDYAISGSVKILENGQVVNRGVPNTGKHPRTAIGISKDNKQIILIAIDGRSENSIGVTHEELADIMLNYGAYNAMNFDGGGSTTFALKDGNGPIKVMNELSDGTQRKVINGLGVINKSTVSDATEIKIQVNGKKFSPNSEIKLALTGHDEYGNVSNPDIKNVKWTFTGVKGKLIGDKFIASAPGKLKLNALYGNAKDTIEIDIGDTLDKIRFVSEEIIINNGVSQKLEVYGLDESNNVVQFDSKKVKYSVYPRTLGTVTNGQFKAGTKYEKGYIAATYLDKVTNIPVIVGGKAEVFNDFNKGDIKISIKSSAENLEANTKYSTTQTKGKGKSILLDYKFIKSQVDQGVGIIFDEPIILNEKMRALGFDIYGDNSGNFLGINLKDADGKSYNLQLADKVNWTGYRYKSITLDNSISYPISIEKVYVYTAKYAKIPKKSTIFIDNLYIQKVEKTDDIKLPQNNLESNLKTIVNDSKDKNFNMVVLDSFDWYDIKKQVDYIKNINATYKLVMSADNSKKIEKDIKVNKLQNKNVNTQFLAQDVQVIYLFSEDKDMYKFLETNLLESSKKNFVIVTDQLFYDETVKKNNKQLILDGIINDANKQDKNILIITKAQYVEANVGNVKYIPLHYENVDQQAVKIKIMNGKMKYGYLK